MEAAQETVTLHSASSSPTAATRVRLHLPPSPSNTWMETERELQRSAQQVQALLAARDGQALLGSKLRLREASPLLDAVTPAALEALMPDAEPRGAARGSRPAGSQQSALASFRAAPGSQLARGASRGTREVAVLSKWLEAQTRQFNESFGAQPEGSPTVDFLVLAAATAKRLYAKAYHELTRQVTIHCDQRGRLMADIWLGYNGMVDSVLRRLRDEYQRERQVAAAAGERAALLQLELDRLQGQSSGGEAEDGVGGLYEEPSTPGKARGHGHLRSGSIAAGDAAGLPGSPGNHRFSMMAKRSTRFADPGQMLHAGRASTLLTDGLLKDAGHLEEGETFEKLQNENESLKDALEVARMELFDAYKKIAELEYVADEVVGLESRVEMAENERDDLLDRMRCLTPRPPPNPGDFLDCLGEEGFAVFTSVLEDHKHWAAPDLAELLVGGFLTPGSHLSDSIGVGLSCLGAAVGQGAIERDAVKQAVIDGDASALTQFANGEEIEQWLSTSFSSPLAGGSADHITDFLIGSNKEGSALSADCYACLRSHVPDLTLDEACMMVEKARASTQARVATVETELPKLRKSCKELQETVQGYRDQEQRREIARRRREEEALLEKKNPIQQYIDLLQSQDEAAWKDTLIGMGQGPEIPKLFRLGGKVRNKHIAKRDTEKLVKEIWKERMNDPAAYAGKAGDLVDFVCNFLQKKVGIMAAVVEMGYNFLYGLWKYQWDADCELFLKILQGEASEDVYIAQVRAQEELEDLFEALDKAKGQTSGFLQKDDLRMALIAYFKVGQRGGKTYKRFDELMQALDEDQEGDVIEWTKVFEEDREFNQGEFAEAIRDQFLQERIEFFKALEEHIYEEAAHQDDCTRQHVVRALMTIDLEMTEKAAAQVIAPIFGPDVELMAVKTIMRKISRGIVQKGRASTSVRMSMAKMKLPTTKSAGRRGNNKPPSDAILSALEAVRKEWIQRELSQTKKAQGESLQSSQDLALG